MAHIWNINSPLINSTNFQHLLLDTNILLDVFYSNASKEVTHREISYQNFVTKCLSKKIPLYTTEFNIYECFHVIDNISKDLYDKSLSLKEYHKIKDEREKVHKDFKIIYTAIRNALKILPASLSEDEILEYIDITNNYYDLYDFALLKIAKQNGLKYILTNDADFCSNMDYIKPFEIFTQNTKMLNSIN